MFLVYNAVLFRQQVENLNAYILANEQAETSSEVHGSFAGGAGHSSPALSGLRIFQEKLVICQSRANLNLSLGLLIISLG